MLKVGVAKAIINPPLTLPHAGWGAQSHVYASGIEADFYSTVMVLSNGTTEVVVVDLDTGNLMLDQDQRFRTQLSQRLQLEPTSIRISVTHTHAGPLTWFDYYEGSKQVRAGYIADMIEKTIGAVQQARENMEPVTVGASYGHCHMGVNRRQWTGERTVVGVDSEGTVDPTVSVVKFENTKGDTVASIVHYQAHPTILGPSYKFMSPEYPGVTKQVVEQIVGGTCLFLQGAAGNIGPGQEGFKDNVKAMRQFGSVVGTEAAKQLLQLDTTNLTYKFVGVVESGASLGMWERVHGTPRENTLQVVTKTVEMPLQEQISVEEAEKIAYHYKREMENLQQNGGTNQEIKDATFKVKRSFMALERSKLYYGKSTKPVDVQFLRVGDIVMIGLPVEPFCEIGMEIRRRSPFPYTLFSGYTNGWIGYLPIREEYPRGGYEVETTPFSADASEVLVEEVVKVLQELRG